MCCKESIVQLKWKWYDIIYVSIENRAAVFAAGIFSNFFSSVILVQLWYLLFKSSDSTSFFSSFCLYWISDMPIPFDVSHQQTAKNIYRTNNRKQHIPFSFCHRMACCVCVCAFACSVFHAVHTLGLGLFRTSKQPGHQIRRSESQKNIKETSDWDRVDSIFFCVCLSWSWLHDKQFMRERMRKQTK